METTSTYRRCSTARLDFSGGKRHGWRFQISVIFVFSSMEMGGNDSVIFSPGLISSMRLILVELDRYCTCDLNMFFSP